MEVLSLIGAMLLILACGLFVAAEFALITVNRNEVTAAAAQGDKRSAGVLKGLESLSTQLSGAQLGITLTNLGIGFLAEPAVAALVVGPLQDIGLAEAAARTVSITIALLLATLFTMVFGELVPKNLAIARPLFTARYVTGFQRGFSTITGPLLRFFNGTANLILKGLGIEPREELASARSPEELVALADHSATVGTLSPDAAELLKRSVAFGNRRGRDAMTPVSRMLTVREDTPVSELLALSAQTGHSRFPVLDVSGQQAIGMLHIRRALAVSYAERKHTPAGQVMEEPTLLPDTVELDSLADTLREGGLQIAILVDETGGIAGLLTMEDLVEELVGDVFDEHDEHRASRETAPGAWIVDAALRPDEATEVVGVTIPASPDYDTLAGLVTVQLGRFAEEGDEALFVLADATGNEHTVTFRVDEMRGTTIVSLEVLVRELGPTTQNGDVSEEMGEA